MYTPTFFRSVSTLVLITFTSLTMQPLQAALQLPSNTAPTTTPTPVAETQEARLSRTLGEMEDLLTPVSGVAPTAHVKQLRAKHATLAALETDAEQGFTETEKHLKEAKLPPAIMARHHAAVQQFKSRKAEFERLMADVANADDTDQAVLPAKLAALTAFMAKHPNKKTHTPTDPNNLPFRTPDGKVRAPKQTEREFKTSLFKPAPIHLAGPIPDGFALPASNPYPPAPTAADLAPTEDIVLTQAIRDLATSLNNKYRQLKLWRWLGIRDKRYTT